MTATTLPAQIPTLPVLRRPMADDPVAATAGLLLLLATLPFLAAHGLDPRVLDGEPIWLKPMKFSLSMGTYLLTLAIVARFLPERMRTSRAFRLYGALLALAAAIEIVWIGGAAANGQQSHFNETNALLERVYPLMGVLAVVLTSGALVYGIAILRHAGAPCPPALRRAIGLGLVLTFALTVPIAGTLSVLTPLIGTPSTGGTLPLLGWSTEVGDLRPGHFLATHALQAVPQLVWAAGWQSPAAATRAAAGYAALTLAVFAQALAGWPLLPLG